MEFKLRPWRSDDLDSVTKNADSRTIAGFMSDGFPDNREKWKSFLEFALTDKSVFYRAIEINGEAVGGIGITPQKDIHRKNAELGYWLGEPFQGMGIMTRIIREFVPLAFDALDIDRIFAAPFETNLASHRVLEKAGFILEARLEKTVIKDGERLDELIYSIRRKS